MSKIETFLAAVHWCADRSLDPMIKAKLEKAIEEYGAPRSEALPCGSTAARLRSLLNVIPHPGVHLYVDTEVFQLLSDLYSHFAACEAMINRGEALNAADHTHP